MIPAKFDYVRPSSVDEAARALAGGGDDAKVIAGGQSLLPLLRLRLAYPDLLVDVGGLDELRVITDSGDALLIGARTTHYQLVHDPLVAEHCGLLAQAAGTVADPAVRHRGTIGGSLAHGDPAGDLPAVALALDATMIARGTGGERQIAAADFFVDYLTTALRPDEILTGIRVPKLGPGWGYCYEKFHRTAQAWAIVGVAALTRRSNGTVAEARIGLTNMGSVPVRATAAEAAAAGAEASRDALRAAAASADEGTDPPADLHGAPDYRRHLARVLTGRARQRRQEYDDMELEHSFTVPVPEERAWSVLLDVERVAPCMPGATLTSVEGEKISGNIKVKVGPIAMTYAGTARFVEQDPAAHVITLEASGKETRGAGTASATVRSKLDGQGDQTHVTVHTTLNITGRPAQFGRGVMAEVGGKLIGIFAANLAEMLAADQSDGAGPADAPAQDPGPASAAADGPAAPEPALPLEELHLPLRSYNSLRREGVHTVGELAARSEQDLLAIDGIGPASVQEIRTRLADHGLDLGTAAAAAGASEDARPPAAQTARTASANGSAAGLATVASPPPRQADDDALDLLSVAGLPVLKRLIPVLAALGAAALVAVRIRVRRRRRHG